MICDILTYHIILTDFHINMLYIIVKQFDMIWQHTICLKCNISILLPCMIGCLALVAGYIMWSSLITQNGRIWAGKTCCRPLSSPWERDVKTWYIFTKYECKKGKSMFQPASFEHVLKTLQYKPLLNLISITSSYPMLYYSKCLKRAGMGSLIIHLNDFVKENVAWDPALSMWCTNTQ